MKLKKVLLLTVAFILVGAASVFADDVYDYYQAKQVAITINNTEVDAPGLLVSDDDPLLAGQTMVPLNEISSALQALVKQDADTGAIHIYKPDVHTTLFASNGAPFFNVYKGKNQFKFLIMIDHIMTDVDAIKFTLQDPYGDYETLQYLENGEGTKLLSGPEITQTVAIEGNAFQYLSLAQKIDFKSVGKYTLSVYLKLKGSDDYSLVSQKIFKSISK